MTPSTPHPLMHWAAKESEHMRRADDGGWVLRARPTQVMDEPIAIAIFSMKIACRVP